MILKNGTVATPNGLKKTDIVINEGRITNIGRTNSDGIDCTGMYVLPGFIDTHIHGVYGTEFASENEEFDKGLIYEVKNGITSVCCTVRCLPLEETFKAIRNIVKEYERRPKGARIRGIHLEGPFISPDYIGAMNPNWLATPTPELIKRLYDESRGLLKIITIAPEIEGALDSIKTAASLGITVSMGHTASDFETAEKAYACGARQMTHTFNASVPFNHRSPGVLGFALTNEYIKCEAICDFIHLDKATVKMLFMLKNADKINIVSDSGVFSGLGNGEYIIANVKRIVKDGVCKAESGKIAGSCYTMQKGVENLLSLGFDICRISRCASQNPAETLGIYNETGSLEVGKNADICVIDNAGKVRLTLMEGVKYE